MNEREETTSVPEHMPTDESLRTPEELFHELYQTPGSPGYNETSSNMRHDVTAEHYRDATIIAAIHTDASGNRLPGHDFNPDSSFHAQVHTEFNRYTRQFRPLNG